MTTLENIVQDLDPGLFLLDAELDCGLIKGICGCPRSGLVRVLDLCTSFVGCLRGGGASVRIGIDVSPLEAPGLRTNDFVNSVLRIGIVSSELTARPCRGEVADVLFADYFS